MLDRCRDHICLTKCHKQHRQNELDGQVDDPTRVEICVTGDARHMQAPEMSYRLSKTTQTE